MYADDFTMLDYLKSKFGFEVKECVNLPNFSLAPYYKSSVPCYHLSFSHPAPRFNYVFKNTPLENMIKVGPSSFTTLARVLTIPKELLDCPYNQLAMKLNLGLLPS
jgi:hypothetical protein